MSIVVLPNGKNIDTTPLEGIHHDGQPYTDQPVYVTYKVKPFVREFAIAIGRKPPEDINTVSHHERVVLNWIRKEK